MRWILIVWVIWQPNELPVKVHEIEYSNEQECLDAVFEYEIKLLQDSKKWDNIQYLIECKQL